MKPLMVTDQLFGKTTIEAPILIELIQSKPVQRLKKITQYGVPDKYNAKFIRNFSRYEHSIGTMLLLKKLKAAEEEQIAGLLHDISHTAFSHVIDWVVGSTKNEDYQDNQHTNMITTSEVATILVKYGYDPERISNYKLFSLLEQPVPNACADRVDYALREFPKPAIKICLKAMKAIDGKIIFTDIQAATIFALNYLETQENLWSNNESATRYMFFAHMLKKAMQKKIITFDDFWTDDETIMAKLEKGKEPSILSALQMMQVYKQLSYLPKSSKLLHKKFRYVDPFIQHNGKIIRLSSFNTAFKLEIERAQKANDLGVLIPKILEKDKV